MKRARSDSNSAKCKTDWTDFTAQVDEGLKLRALPRVPQSKEMRCSSM